MGKDILIVRIHENKIVDISSSNLWFGKYWDEIASALYGWIYDK